MTEKPEIQQIQQTKKTTHKTIHRVAPLPTEGTEGEERVVEVGGLYYRYHKIDGSWRRIQYS
jgi:hypothetical protein